MSFFYWCATLGKILTTDIFFEGGESLSIDFVYAIGMRRWFDHLPIHCSISWKLWALVFSWLGLKQVMSRNVKEFLLVWKDARVGIRKKQLWAMITICLL